MAVKQSIFIQLSSIHGRDLFSPISSHIFMYFLCLCTTRQCYADTVVLLNFSDFAVVYKEILEILSEHQLVEILTLHGSASFG